MIFQGDSMHISYVVLGARPDAWTVQRQASSSSSYADLWLWLMAMRPSPPTPCHASNRHVPHSRSLPSFRPLSSPSLLSSPCGARVGSQCSHSSQASSLSLVPRVGLCRLAQVAERTRESSTRRGGEGVERRGGEPSHHRPIGGRDCVALRGLCNTST